MSAFVRGAGRPGTVRCSLPHEPAFIPGVTYVALRVHPFFAFRVDAYALLLAGTLAGNFGLETLAGNFGWKFAATDGDPRDRTDRSRAEGHRRRRSQDRGGCSPRRDHVDPRCDGGQRRAADVPERV